VVSAMINNKQCTEDAVVDLGPDADDLHKLLITNEITNHKTKFVQCRLQY